MPMNSCQKCGHKMFPDLAVQAPGECFVDLYCLVCGQRDFISTNTFLGMSLMERNNG